jgi:hypothetical protein
MVTMGFKSMNHKHSGYDGFSSPTLAHSRV